MRRNPLQELRRYASAGNGAQAKRILRDMLDREPEDCFALAELQRMQSGKPLYSTTDFKTYRRIVHEAAVESLHRIMARYPASCFGRMVKSKINKLHATVTLMERRLLDNVQLDEGFAEYKKALWRERGKRTFLAGGRASLVVGIPLALLFIAGVTVWQMRHRAETTAQALEKALAAGDWQRVQTLRDTADSGINNLLWPGTNAVVNKADAWIAHKKAIKREAAKIISALQAGKYSIENLPVAKHALMERYMRDIPKEMNDLAPVWERYCQQAREQWMQQIPEVTARLKEPPPPLPEWTGQADDAIAADRYAKTLKELLSTRQDAVDAYHLDPALLKPVHDRIARIRLLQTEIEAWQRAVAALTSAGNYGDYRKAAASLGTPTAYTPALRLAEYTPRLPEEKTVSNAMRNPGGEHPDELLDVMERTLLEQGATFCKEGPASARQVELLDDLFTTRTLRTKLYRISTPQGDTAFSLKPYTTDGSQIRLKRAEMDPAFRIDKDPGVRWNAAGVRQQTVDPTGLVTAAGLERNTFYVRRNIPAALGNVLNYRHKDCPALAKAYVYDKLLLVIQLHKNPLLIGEQFSPSLREDAQSFLRLKQSLGVKLDAICWLQTTPKAAAAEVAMQKWFRDHGGHNYAEEIRKNYADHAAYHPVYIGYVGLDGKTVLHRAPAAGDDLWYLDDAGLPHRADCAKDLEKAPSFSPLFLRERDKKKKK